MTVTAIVSTALLVMSSMASDDRRNHGHGCNSDEHLTSLSEYHCFLCSLILDLMHPFVSKPNSHIIRSQRSDRSVVGEAV